MTLGVKRIHNERTVDLDRLVIIFPVEEDAAAKPAHTRLALLMHDRVRPESHDLARTVQFLFVLLPGETHVQVERCAAACQQQHQHQQ